jgi:hypothetical protein
MTRYLLLVPGGLRTGGPEALYQLSDMLFRIGASSAMVQMSVENIKKISTGQMDGLICENNLIINDYKFYNFSYVDSVDQNDVIIVPECYINLIPILLRKNKCVVWWLSVDNSFGALAGLNFSWLYHPGVRHVVQSNYAMDFLNAFGLKSKYLTDYVILNNDEVVSDKEKIYITFNAGPKVPYNIEPYLRDIGKSLGLECIPLIGLDKKSCEDFLKKSVFYIDMGKNPGKDRAPREALLAGAMVFVSKVGAGLSDYNLPGYFCVEPWNINGLRIKIVNSFANKKIISKLLINSRKKLTQEMINFESEVVDLVVGDN